MIFIVYKIKINKVLNQACNGKWAMYHIHITVCVCNNRKVEIVGSVRLYMHLQWDSRIHENHTSKTSKSVRKKFSKYGYHLKQFIYRSTLWCIKNWGGVCGIQNKHAVKCNNSVAAEILWVVHHAYVQDNNIVSTIGILHYVKASDSFNIASSAELQFLLYFNFKIISRFNK